MTTTEPHRDQLETTEDEPLTARQATELTERIRATLHTGHKLLLAAWRGRAHEAMGYAGAEGWARYCSEEFAQARMLRIDAETRREIVAEMRAGGMSTRAIASGLGVSQSTAATDAAATDQNRSDGPPAMVTSLDGRRRPASRPAPESAPPTLSEAERQAVLDAHVDDSALRQARWSKAFARAINRVGEPLRFDAGDIREQGDAELVEAYAGLIADLSAHHARATAPVPGGATVTDLRRAR